MTEYYNDGQITVKESTKEDALYLSKHLRESDVKELWASDNVTPEGGVLGSFAHATISLTVHGENPIAMFGVSELGEKDGSARIWLLATDELEDIKFRFLKYSRSFIQGMLSEYTFLYNWVFAENEKTKLWLEACGAKIFKAEPYGKSQNYFNYFTFSKDIELFDTKKLKQLQKLCSRKNMDTIEKQMAELPGAQFGDNDDCPVDHHFGDGLYTRTITMPAGKLVISRIHKFNHPFFLTKGKVTVIDEKGVKTIEAPYKGITEQWTRRLIYVHEETEWTTVHRTNTTNVSEAVAEVTAKSFAEMPKLEIDGGA